jgi:hypothetical protein
VVRPTYAGILVQPFEDGISFKFSSYLAGNTLILRYKAQPVNASVGNKILFIVIDVKKALPVTGLGGL